MKSISKISNYYILWQIQRKIGTFFFKSARENQGILVKGFGKIRMKS